ncbi:modification methylase [Salmonella sp. 3DZ2-4SM]|nr:modification methylase [Salmonella sp. 3DZ2-4SM]
MANLNQNLRRASKLKNDEFYTQLEDIEKELRHYKEYFKDKVVYCNADDPRISNFFHYFSYNFEHLGLKKLITTCYKNQNMDLFSMHNQEKAIALIYEGEKDNGKVPTIDNIGVIELEGDGDFRSPESIEFLKEADIVVTNPPFSLFREYIYQLIDFEKDFLVIGNINALTYKEIFNLIKSNKMWLGYNTTRYFLQPNGNLFETARTYWYTNLDIKKRHEDIILYKKYNPDEFPKYDNYNAINVDKTTEIPMDYDGFIGVPITFMDKYNPEQFDILGIMNTGEDNPGIRYPNSSHGRPIIKGKEKYLRIIIKNKKVIN